MELTRRGYPDLRLQDGNGKRVQKSNAKLYWYGMSSDPLTETDLSGTPSAEFIFFNGKRTGRLDLPGAAVHYYFSDHLGSASVITNASGTVPPEEESDYYPFGGERTVTNTDANQYKFTAKERDLESGLDFFMARYYASNLGRFTSPDEFTGGPVSAYSSNDPAPPGPLPYADITDPQSLNKYAYTYNNPVNYTDPEGHCPIGNCYQHGIDQAKGLLLEGIRSFGLDAAGFLPPPVGPIADGANAIVSLVKGDVGGAALNAAAMVPLAGDALKGAKMVDKAVDLGKAANKLDDAADAAKAADKAADTGRAAKDFTPAGKREIDARDASKCQDCGRDVTSVQNKKGEPTPADQRQRHHIKPKRERGRGVHLIMQRLSVPSVTKRNTRNSEKGRRLSTSEMEPAMNSKSGIAGDYSVEIWFRIEKDKDGYPKSKTWEQLLARPVTRNEEYFQIESVPFFLKNVSRGDVVKAKVVQNAEISEQPVFEFERLVDRGGHNTYRLLLRKRHPEDPRFTEDELLRKGLAVEQRDGDFFAVDVPPRADQKAIDDYLVAEQESGRWELQDGYLHSIKTTQEAGGPNAHR